MTNDGVIVLQVTDNPQQHQDALADDVGQACVVHVTRNESEIRRIQEQLFGALVRIVPGAGTAPGSLGRVEISVPVADRKTVEAVAALVDDRESIRIVGRAILLRDK